MKFTCENSLKFTEKLLAARGFTLKDMLAVLAAPALPGSLKKGDRFKFAS